MEIENNWFIGSEQTIECVLIQRMWVDTVSSKDEEVGDIDHTDLDTLIP